jgi:hypothetical protein
MFRRYLFILILFTAGSLGAQPFSPAREWRGAIIGHTDNKDYFIRANIKLVQKDMFRGEFSIINSNYSGDFISDMKLSGDRLQVLNFQAVKEYPKPNPNLKACFSGYFQMSLIGKDSVRILDLYRNPVNFSTLTDYQEDSVTGEMRPNFECFSFMVLSNNQKDTALLTLEKKTDSILAIKKVKTDISKNRVTVTGKQFQTKQDTIEIHVWDNNVIDGDSISLKLNDDWILTNQMLKRDKMIFRIPLANKLNELLLLAENLGKVPPNTAAISLIDAAGVKTFYLQSDFKKSEVLKIIKISP